MSYILDALKKAEAERNVGAVPTMHAQPLMMPATAPRPPLWRQPWLWAALAAVLLMLALVAWLTPWKPVIPAGAGRPAPAAAAAPAAPPPAESAAVPEPPPVPPLANAPVEPAPPSGGAAEPEANEVS